MELPSNLVEKYTTPKSKARNPRDAVVDKTLNRINAWRKSAKVELMSLGELLRLLTGLDHEQIYRLYQECDGAERFEGLLKWKIKNNK